MNDPQNQDSPSEKDPSWESEPDLSGEAARDEADLRLRPRQYVHQERNIFEAEALSGEEASMSAEPSRTKSEPKPEAKASLAVDSKPAPEEVAPEEVEALATEEAPEAVESDEAEKAAKSGFRWPKLGIIEWLASGAFVALLLLVLLWGLKEAWNFPKSSHEPQRVDFPVKGKFVEVVAFEDFWRAPKRVGSNPDRARLGMKILPACRMTVGAGDADLIVFFDNADGDRVGDPHRFAVRSGQILGMDGASVDFASTIGFTGAGALNAYRRQKGQYWSIEVMEGPPGAKTDEFQLLFRQDIGTKFEGELSTDLYE